MHVVERYNSIIAKYVGGKRINYSLGGSYGSRCATAVVQHNTGKAHHSLHKTVFNKHPNKFIQNLELKRLKRRSIITKPKKKVFSAKDEHYGTDTCQKPDLSDEEFNLEKIKLIEALKENCKNRNEIERETIDQANCNKWMEIRSKLLTASNFGKVCRAKESSYPGYVKSILHSKFTSKETSYGTDNESKAIQQMEKQLNIKIDRCGIFIDKNDYFLAASPDGLI